MKKSLFIALSIALGINLAWGENAEGQKLAKQARAEISNFQLTQADQHYKQAIDVIEQELDYSEAESKSVRAEWKKLQNVNLYLADGNRALENRDYTIASDQYQQAIKKMDSYKDTIWTLAKAEAYYQWGMVFYSQDKDTEAAYKYREAIKLAPANKNYPKALFNVVAKHYNGGLKFYKRRDFQNAKSEFEKSVQVDPTFSKGYYLLALLAKQDNDATQAMNYYQQAIQNDQQYYLAWFGLGKLYSDLGRLNKAIEAFSQVIQINPMYQKAFFQRGQAYLNTKQKSKGIADLKKALVLDKNYTLAFEALGKVYIDDKNYPGVISLLSRTKNTRTASYKTYYFLALAYNETQDFDNALKCSRNSLLKKSKWAPAYFEKGRALAGLKRKNEAIAAFKQAAKDARWKSNAQYEIDSLTKWAGK